MLPENCNGFKYDDLVENSIWVEDGGDGTLNGADYILFYANGPDEWSRDSLNQRFSHRKNLYSSDSYYYITIGGNGKRVQPLTPVLNSNTVITAFNDRYFHELDTFNFLSSGKQWFGDEFSSLPGRMLSRTYNIPIPNILNDPAILITNLLSRSFNVPGNFSVRVNNQQLGQLALPPVASGPYDQFASMQQSVFFLLGIPVLICPSHSIMYPEALIPRVGWIGLRFIQEGGYLFQEYNNFHFVTGEVFRRETPVSLLFRMLYRQHAFGKLLIR